MDDTKERCPVCNGVITIKKAQRINGLGIEEFETKHEQETDKNGNLLYDSVQLGQVEERAVNMLNFYPQKASQWKHVRHAVELEAMDIDAIKEAFGNKAKDIAAESLDVDSWDAITGPNFETWDTDDTKESRDQAIVKWLRHVPSKIFPKGQLIVTCSGHVLHKGPLDSIDGQLPYRFERWRAIPNTFWACPP